MPLFETLPVSREDVQTILDAHWGDGTYVLGKLLKDSQNHTFEANDERDGKPVIVRVTPDPKHDQLERITTEVTVLEYFNSESLQYVSTPIPTRAPATSATASSPHTYAVHSHNCVVVVFEYATGSPIEFTTFQWAVNEQLVRAWGGFHARLRQLCMKLRRERPEVYARVRRYDELHDGVMKGAAIEEEDRRSMESEEHFGLIHGDINVSNFFVKLKEGEQGDSAPVEHLYVFDWDQMQRGWFMYDLAQAVFGIVMTKRAGMPISGTPVELGNIEQFTNWIVAGYEEEMNRGEEHEHFRVDRAELARMVEMRRQFYELFCRRALVEFEEEATKAAAITGEGTPEESSPLEGMKLFCKFVVDWMDRERMEATTATATTATATTATATTATATTATATTATTTPATATTVIPSESESEP